MTAAGQNRKENTWMRGWKLLTGQAKWPLRSTYAGYVEISHVANTSSVGNIPAIDTERSDNNTYSD